MLTLGINAAFHDSSACIVRDGRVVAAAEEERFTGIKHGKRPVPFSAYELPFHAIDYCLGVVGATLDDLDHVAYSFNPFLLTGELTGQETMILPLEPSRTATVKGRKEGDGWKPKPSKVFEANGSPWEPLFISYIVNAPRHLRSGAPHHLQKRLNPGSRGPTYEWHFVDHHLSHAVSAFYPSPFSEAAIMALDGRGERATTSYWLGSKMDVDLIDQVEYPHSLGLLYERVTEHLGFLHSSDEYKVMALASFGAPRFVGRLRDSLTVLPSGRYLIRPVDFEEYGPKRLRGEPFEQWHYDLARSLQVVLEETVLEIAEWLRLESDSENLCIAGGVALNCVMNGRLRDAGIFRRIWVQPAAGDAGTCVGAALWTDAEARRPRRRMNNVENVYLGPEFEVTEIESLLRAAKLEYRKPTDLVDEVAECLVAGKVAGWFQGRMEFGPRALGARSILASPLDPSMQQKLNDIKDREDFRPVAPAVLEEYFGDWFEPNEPSPYMLFVHRVRPDKQDLIPAVRHVDGTARIQTVARDQNPLYYELIRRFGERTGVPVVVNTSLNTRGKPIVCTPRDAIECFMTSPLDVLAIGPFVLEK